MIETERLLLRRPRLDDADDVLRFLRDPETMEFIGGVHPEPDAGLVLARWIGRWDANGAGPFIVERRTDGEWLGRTGILVWDTRTWRTSTLADAGEHAQPELGWAFLRAHWGHGYATEAARAARGWARSERGIGRLISLISPANVRSVRVAEKLEAKPTAVELEQGQAVVWVHPR